MSQFEVKLPSLGKDAGDKATVSVFFRDAGDAIKEGDDLVEMVTDKATFTVPSPVSGKIVSTNVGENDVVKVGDILAVVDIGG
jgi:pyruvate dehydrogenase E2 component (dihydrolipoamide acetyltransferase)